MLPPDLDSLELAPSDAGAGQVQVVPDQPSEVDDPFELPTAPITPLPEPAPALTAITPPPRVDNPDVAVTLDLSRRVTPPATSTPRSGPALLDAEEALTTQGPRAKTLELMPTTTAARWAPPQPPADNAYQADTADLTPRFPAPPQDVAVPVPVTTALPSGPRYDVDTVDLGVPVSGWKPDGGAGPFGRRLEPAPAWQPPPLDPAPAWQAAPSDPSNGFLGVDLPAPVPTTPPPVAKDPDTLDRLRRPEADRPRRGDEAHEHERPGNRLSPAVLRGLGLAPLAEGATPDEPTRNGWPTGRRPAPSPTGYRRDPFAAPGSGDQDAPGRLDLDDDDPGGAADRLANLAMQDLELPTPRTRSGTRTPGEILLRSSAPDALAAALASELDRGAPLTESPDDRARRRITALLERASAAARAGEHPMSIAAIDLALSEAPDSAVAQKLVHRSRDIILDCYQRYFGDLSRRPVPVGSLTELTGRPLDPRAAFLVSRMDGNLTYEEILDVAGMGRLEACRHLAQLLVRGIIRAN